MGLDMYLSARKYVSGVDFSEDYSARTMPINFKNLLNLVGLEDGDIRTDLPSANIDVTVAYWRKANAIHNWFVNNCADGVDDCRPMYVSRSKLEELLETIREAIVEKDSDILPPAPGFFFGPTDADEWYWESLDSSKDTIRDILENPNLKDWDFEYQASW